MSTLNNYLKKPPKTLSLTTKSPQTPKFSTPIKGTGVI